MPAWTGNYSRDMTPSSRRKQYVRTLLQQGTEVADADGNDAQALAYEKLRTFISLLGGPAFFFEDGYKVVADGSNNDVEFGLGSGFIEGHEAYLAVAARYVSLGASHEDKNLHSVSSALTATVLTDSAMNWAVNELVGRALFPDITSGTSFVVVSNTATTITVVGDMTTVAAAGDTYYLGMSTPSGGNRTDTVWLNLYLDEVSAAEDSYLFHNLGSGIELDRRVKVRTIIQVEQGTSVYASYTDVDNLPHFLVKLATIQRFDGVAAINPGDVADNRITTTSAGGSVVVSGGDTVGGNLNSKLDVVTPLVKTIQNPGGNEVLRLEISSPGDPAQFLRGTSPPSWAVPAGGGGGSGSELAGKTFQPHTNLATRRLFSAPFLGVTGDTSLSLDLSALGVTVPAGATHILLKILTDVDFVAGAGSFAFTTYAGPYTATPSTLITADQRYFGSFFGFNSATEANVAETTDVVFAMNDPALPAGDVTIIVDVAVPGGGSVNMSIQVYLEGFLITDSGSSPSPVSFAAEKAAPQALANTTVVTPVTITFPSEEFDEGANFVGATGIFTAPVDGKYLFHANIQWDNVTNGGGGVAGPQITAQIFVNGAVVERAIGVPANDNAETDPSQPVTALVNLVAGDTVEVRAGHDTTAGARNVAASSRFQGVLLTAAGVPPVAAGTVLGGIAGSVTSSIVTTLSVLTWVWPADTKSLDINIHSGMSNAPSGGGADNTAEISNGHYLIDVDAGTIVGSAFNIPYDANPMVPTTFNLAAVPATPFNLSAGGFTRIRVTAFDIPTRTITIQANSTFAFPWGAAADIVARG